MQFRLRAWGQVLLATSLFTVAANAAILGTYSDRASWEAVVNSGTRTDVAFTTSMSFNMTASGISQGSTSFVGFYNEATSGNFTYRENLGLLTGLNLASFGWAMIGGGSTSTTNYNAGMTITPAAGVTALGFDFGSYADNNTTRLNNTSSTQFLVRIFEGGNPAADYFVSGANRPNLAFFGVASSGNISGVQLFTRNLTATSGYTTYAVVDNYSFGTTTLSGGGGDPPPPSGGDVPEPSTYILAGLGLIGLAALRKKS